MDRNLRHVTLGLIIGIALISLLVFILPIDVIYKVPVNTKVYPVKEWQLIQDQSDYFTKTVTRSKESPTSVQNYIFQRGDVVNIHLSPSLYNGMVIQKDSVLLTFSSQMLTLRIQQALNERAIQFSNLRSEQSAMKVPLYLEAQNNVGLAKANLQLQTLNMERMSSLYEEGVISKLELDQQTNTFKVAEQELKIAEQKALNTTFEGKPEDVEVFATRMATAEKELQILLNQEREYVVKAPFTGTVTLNPAEGVLLTINDTGMKSLVFPFPIHEKSRLGSNPSLVYEQDGQEFAYPFNLEDQAGVLAGGQYLLGSAMDPSITAAYGEMNTAYVRCDTLRLGEYIMRKLGSYP